MGSAPTDTVAAEHEILIGGCGLLDRSERGKLALSGSGAVEFLNGQVTNELGDLRPGEGRFAAFLTHKGKMLGDLRILAVGGRGNADEGAGDPAPISELLLDTERCALQALFDMIRRFKIGYEVQLDKRTLERGLLSLIGPESDAIAGARELPLQEHASARAEIERVPVLLIRTDVGVDLLCDSARTRSLAGALRARGAQDVSEQATECLRIEHGRPRYGIDIDESAIPQEAGLNERAVSFTKGCYVGQETVARLYYKGRPNRLLRGLRMSAPAEHGDVLQVGDRTVGHVGSSAVSPVLGPIALAVVRREAEPGTSIEVGESGAPATVLELPFPAA